jgi:hypothetical protein
VTRRCRRNSRLCGERLGACPDCRRFWAKYRADEIDDEEIDKVEGQLGHDRWDLRPF